MITTKKLYSALQTSVRALTCTSCSVCWCSSSKIGKVCSAVQCSRIRWITLQPYGWVESTNTLKIGLQTKLNQLKLTSIAILLCSSWNWTYQLLSKKFCLPRPEFCFQQKSGKTKKQVFVCQGLQKPCN